MTLQIVPDWFDNEELFKKRLIDGRKWEDIVAQMFRLRGASVIQPKFEIRESVADRHKYINSVDMFVNGKPIEIKSKELPFLCWKDYPNYYCKIDTVSGYDAKRPKPLFYIIVSKPEFSMLCIPSKIEDSKNWEIKEYDDKEANIRKEKWYVCNKNQLYPMSYAIKHLI